jgi:hypothetical protein
MRDRVPSSATPDHTKSSQLPELLASVWAYRLQSSRADMKYLLLALLAGCFPTRSGEYACDTDADCERGRTCTRSVCVVSDVDAAAPDATSNVADATPADAAPRVCDTSGLTCANATTHVDCSGACWVTCAEQVTQATAQTRCTAWGGEVTPLRTAADAMCFDMVQLNNQMWLGLVQAANATAPETQWSWSGDNVPPLFFRWDNGEPDDSGGNENDHDEQCARVQTDDLWADVSCDDQYAFACRR